ncbi:MAG: hypothetical protein Q8918_19260, partial [Bacteroidota bacterium]|nr:hypothetical protein [Bacteroidota bacterium]
MQGAWKRTGLGRISHIRGQKLFVSLNGIWETGITILSKPIYRKNICMAGWAFVIVHQRQRNGQ